MVKTITTEQLVDMFAKAKDILAAKEDLVNNLNVYPVPDGDTGTNMYLTLKEIAQDLEKTPVDSMSELADIISESSLMGARGNSGVILSQFIGGFAEIIKKHQQIDNIVFYDAFKNGTKEAYASVSNPVEGTILTVMKSATEEIKNHKSIKDLQSILKSAINRSQFTLKKTPDMLQKLKDAGVVDAGGAGFVYFLEGFYKSFSQNGKDPVSATDDFSTPQLARVWSENFGVFGTGGVRSIIDFNVRAVNYAARNLWWILKQGWSVIMMGKNLVSIRKAVRLVTSLARQLKWQNIKSSNVAISKLLHAWESYPEEKYCFEVILTGVTESPEELRKILKKHGTSLIVAKQGKYTKVHFHVTDDKKATALLKKYGKIKKKKVDDLRKQQNLFMSKRAKAHQHDDEGTRIIAVVNASGFKKIYESFEGVYTLDGGKTMNPSVSDFQQLLDKIDCPHIIILPNNKNVFMAAQKVATKTTKIISIAKTTDQAQGLTALLNFNKNASLNKNFEIITNALNNIQTFSVTQATRKTKIHNKSISAGNYITLTNKKLYHSGSNMKKVIEKTIKKFLNGKHLVTLYYGNGISKQSAEKLVRALKKSIKVEFQLYDGSQPHYPYIVSIE